MVRKGYDPDQVRTYLGQLAERIDSLERDLFEAQAERDAAMRRYSSAKEEAYGQLAGRVTDVLRSADQEAGRLRREAEQDAGRQIAEARQRAEQIILDAQVDADRTRAEGEELLRSAEEEAKRTLGGLESARAELVAKLAELRGGLVEVLGRLDDVTEAAEPDDSIGSSAALEPSHDGGAEGAGFGHVSADPVESGPDSIAAFRESLDPGPESPAADTESFDPREAVAARREPWEEESSGAASEPDTPVDAGPTLGAHDAGGEPVDVEADDLLGTSEGFNLVIPDLLGSEEEAG